MPPSALGQPEQRANQRRLAGAIGAEIPERAAPRDKQLDVIDRDVRPEPLGEAMRLHRPAACGRTGGGVIGGSDGRRAVRPAPGSVAGARLSVGAASGVVPGEIVGPAVLRPRRRALSRTTPKVTPPTSSRMSRGSPSTVPPRIINSRPAAASPRAPVTVSDVIVADQRSPVVMLEHRVDVIPLADARDARMKRPARSLAAGPFAARPFATQSPVTRPDS